MKHEDLVEIGFKSLGEDEGDPFYKIVFEPPFNFGIVDLSGELDGETFKLWSNNKEYTSKQDLKQVIDIIGSKIRR